MHERYQVRLFTSGKFEGWHAATRDSVPNYRTELLNGPIASLAFDDIRTTLAAPGVTAVTERAPGLELFATGIKLRWRRLGKEQYRAGQGCA
jgi:hypothetical protein